MPSPIQPSIFQGVIPTTSGSTCDKFQKAFKTFPQAFSDWYSYVYNEDGSFTTDFMTDVCGIDCAALAAAGSGGSSDLASPTPIFSTPNAAFVRLTWAAVPGASRYEIVRSDSYDLHSATHLTTITDTTHDDTTVASDTYYFYWVRAINSANVIGPYSTAVITFTSSGSSLSMDTPTVTATVGTNPLFVEVNWNFIEGATSYDVVRSPDTDVTHGTRLFQTNQLFFNDYSALTGTTYYYFILPTNRFLDSTDYVGYSTATAGSR